MDPVVAVGTLLSVGLAAGFYFYHELAPALATFAGLLGIIITLQIEEMTKERRRAEQETRLGGMLAKIERSDWLPDTVESMLDSVTRIEREYPDSPAVVACRQAMEECRDRLGNLESGRFQFPYTDNELALRMCQNMQREFVAISFASIDLRWWQAPEGRRYWDLQLDALARGVVVRRVFVYDDWSAELAAVAREQRDAGVVVRRVHQDTLPVGARGIIGIWDRMCGLEVSYDASGQAVLFSYTVAEADLDRLRRQFDLVERMAIDLDDSEPDPTTTVTGAGQPS
jgi:hypothetical protein